MVNLLQSDTHKKSRNLISYLATLAVIGVILFLTRNQWPQFLKVTQISFKTIIWLSILLILIEVCNGYKLKLLVKPFNVTLTSMEWLGLDFVRAFGNYLPLSAGVVTNAAYLKYRKDLDIAKFVSCMLGNTVIMIGTYGILNILLLLFRFLTHNVFNWLLFFVAVAFVFFAFVIIFIKVDDIKYDNRVVKSLKRVYEGWILIKDQRDLLFKIVILQIIIIFFLALRYKIVFQELAYTIDMPAVIVLAVMTTVIRFVSIFPANLGLREGLAGGVTQIFGLSFGDGVLVAVIIRLTETFWIFVLGIIFSFFLAGYKKTTVKNNHSTP